MTALTAPPITAAPRERERVFGRGWAAPAVRERRAPRSVVVLAAAAAIAATIWSAHTNSMLLYGDARAHLNVARRITDGLHPGLSQLGSVWLPIPHLLMVPFAAVRSLWQTGVAGAIAGGVCFVYTCTRTFTLVDELTDNRTAAWWAFLLMAANANLLYLQTTALTEPVLLAFFVGAVFHFARWMRTFSLRSLVMAAVMTFLATLTRYEGWALLAAGVVVIVAWSLHADRREKSPQANLLVYGAVGGYGIVLWLLYNQIIFGSALYFLNSKYSASVINGSQAQFGLLGTKHNVAESFLTYGWDVLGIVGPALVIAGLASALVVVLKRHPGRVRDSLVLLLLLAPVAFEFLSLYVGQTTIRVPQRPPYAMWNVRYGVMALPFCAVAVGLLVARARRLGRLAVCAGIFAAVAMMVGTPLALADGRTGTSSAAAGHPERAARYLHNHYRDGLVLADDAAASAFIFAADIDLDQFVTAGAHPDWENALATPANVRWVVAKEGDAVAADMAAHPARFHAFRKVFTEGDLRIFERRER